jgi:hypothetical protein
VYLYFNFLVTCVQEINTNCKIPSSSSFHLSPLVNPFPNCFTACGGWTMSQPPARFAVAELWSCFRLYYLWYKIVFSVSSSVSSIAVQSGQRIIGRKSKMLIFVAIDVVCARHVWRIRSRHVWRLCSKSRNIIWPISIYIFFYFVTIKILLVNWKGHITVHAAILIVCY